MRKRIKSKRISGNSKNRDGQRMIKRKKRGRCYDTEYQKQIKLSLATVGSDLGSPPDAWCSA